MYKKEKIEFKEVEDFKFSPEERLNPQNRWVIMASLIPWDEFEEEYASNFHESLGASLLWLNKNEQEKLETIKKMYEQQLWMYENNKKSVENRIVSLHKPYVRPIVRRKAGKKVEFGAKISASYVDKFIFLDRLSWDNYNESGDLKNQIEKYFKNMGYYPASVHADKIYRTRENRRYCKEKGIRLSGPPLGRPPKNISIETKRQAAEDERIRSAIEGKFGQGKRRFNLDLVKMKRSDTSETAIAISFLVINLNTLYLLIKRVFLFIFQKKLEIALFNYQNLSFRDKSKEKIILN